MSVTAWTAGQTARLEGALAAARQSRRFDIGFPGATDLQVPELAEWMTRELLNNIGDPSDPGHGRNHTKDFEREVVRIVGNWLHAPDSAWGYVTSGASEGTEHALDAAWQRYPDVVVYFSVAAHYSVWKAARKLKLPCVQIRSYGDDRMDIDDLASELGRRRDRAAIIVATAGTTMSEAVDDVASIAELCDALVINRRFIHVDAALSGIPLALLDDTEKPPFDFRSGATSMVVSGHKFLSTLHPCGVLVYAQPPWSTGQRVSYTGSVDTTISGSRSGHTPLILWTLLTRLGYEGHRRRAESARDLAAYAKWKLDTIGWPASRNLHAMTVVLRTPPRQVLDKWVLAHDEQWAHIVTVPGVSPEQIDEFCADLSASPPPDDQPTGRRLVPGILSRPPQ